jgi:hypothetical protein
MPAVSTGPPEKDKRPETNREYEDRFGPYFAKKQSK